MALISFTPQLQRFASTPEVQCAAATLREALEAAFGVDPRLRGYVLDDQGHPRANVVCFIDGRRCTERIALAAWTTRDGGATLETLREGLPQRHAHDLAYRHGLTVADDGTFGCQHTLTAVAFTQRPPVGGVSSVCRLPKNPCHMIDLSSRAVRIREAAMPHVIVVGTRSPTGFLARIVESVLARWGWITGRVPMGVTPTVSPWRLWR